MARPEETSAPGTRRIYRRSGFDRRTDIDRRQAIDLDVLDRLGRDRRKGERRRRPEARAGWVRLGRWSSVFVGRDIQFRLEVLGTSLPLTVRTGSDAGEEPPAPPVL